MFEGSSIMAVKKQREARRAVNQPGWITLEGGFAARQCTVIDRSANGAKVVVDDPAAIQKNFRLALTRDARAGLACEVAWRRGKTLGIKFVR
jgi:PilZ domain-containing protein